MSEHAELFSEGLLKDFTPDETESFLSSCEEISCPNGANLFMELTEATTLYLILSGAIELHFEMPKRENADTLIATLKPGDAVGWSSVVPPYQYRLSGYCKGATRLFKVDRDALEGIFESNYHLAYLFMRNIAVLTGRRLHQVQDKLARVLADEAVTGW